VNRRLFAMAVNGIPDGIKCDMGGNVYSSCGDGINVWYVLLRAITLMLLAIPTKFIGFTGASTSSKVSSEFIID
jgi:sugar lactone lactonase YvrE